MSETDLYDDLIMEHIRNARNYRAPERADLTATGSNPLCGDEITIYLGLERGRIESISFQCTCCGISMASASIMTQMLKGRRPSDSKILLRSFVALMNSRADPEAPGPTREQRAVLAAVRKFPSRARCASLPWSTLESALDDRWDASHER